MRFSRRPSCCLSCCAGGRTGSKTKLQSQACVKPFAFRFGRRVKAEAWYSTNFLRECFMWATVSGRGTTAPFGHSLGRG